MLIAKQTDTTIEIADHAVFLPNTSFPVGGPTVSQIVNLGFLQVTVWKAFNHNTEKLVAVAPYLEDGQVFTVQVEPKTLEEMDQDIANKKIILKSSRAEAYRNESDPLFFKWQRGETTEQNWLDKVTEIKSRT